MRHLVNIFHNRFLPVFELKKFAYIIEWDRCVISRLKSSKDHGALRVASRFISLSTKLSPRIYNGLREALRCTLSEILSCAADGRVVRGRSIGGDKGLGNCVLKRILQRRSRRNILALLAKSCAILTRFCAFIHPRKVESIAAPRETFRV